MSQVGSEAIDVAAFEHAAALKLTSNSTSYQCRSVCPTSCKAPEGPVCQAACQFDDLAKMFNTFIEGQQVRECMWDCQFFVF